MSIFSKIFAVSLIAVSSLLSFASGTVSASAGNTSVVRIVTASNGLNYRDANCNKIDVLSKGEVVWVDNTNQITCKINGVSVKLTEVGTGPGRDNGYISLSYTAPVLYASNFDYNKPFYVNATSGLNLRNDNCKRVGAVSKNTQLTNIPGDGFPVCERDGKFYLMTHVEYNGNWYWVANYYLRN